MSLLKKFFLLGVALSITACVTINVYFPSAEVEDAAEQIIQDVIGTSGQNDDDSASFHSDVRKAATYAYLNPINWVIGSAHAQNINIKLSSPAIREITARMKSRFNSALKAYLDSGTIGFSNQGFVETVNPDALNLKERQQVRKLIADENRDRKALYRELAVANKHPEWEEQIQDVFLREWIDEAQAGWYYQNAQGAWVKK
ncbi:YdbL family protein [Marinicella sp. W31]|uniref:YdbL family protein n=1 Tax=Marinicella sp. W31 TaxID=3023713 RepID=UPI003756D6A3